MRLVWLCVVLFFAAVACSREAHVASETPVSQGKARPPSTKTPEATLRELLEEEGLPAASVVIEISTGNATMAGAQGADPTKLAHRPASTVKPLLFLSALELGTVEATHEHDCQGTMHDDANFQCWAVHGTLDIAGAIAASCNIFTWNVSDAMGYPRVRTAFSEWGFGEPTGLVPGENPGVLPTLPSEPDEKRDLSIERLTSFGHGELRVTVLQLAKAYADLSGKLQEAPERYSQVSKGLRDAIDEGTGNGARVEGFPLWGKTGSAEHLESGDPTGKMDGWFVVLAPADSPQFVVATHVLGHGGGGKTAAPLTKKIVVAWIEHGWL